MTSSDEPFRLSRRALLAGAAALAAASCRPARPDLARARSGRGNGGRPVTLGEDAARAVRPEVELPTAGWLQAENRRPGTSGWWVTGRPVPHAIEGYADRVSAASGDRVVLFVNTAAPTFHVEVYRMGWYQGLGARLVWRSGEVPGRRQPAAGRDRATNMVECAWAPSLTLTVRPDWPSGNYLLKLVASDGQEQFVPLTVRDDASRAALVVQNAVTTWQAYNQWGGYSLYLGRSGTGMSYANRARVVSYDRPYALADADWANGATDWLGNEYPLVMLVERLGLDVTYWTDIDLAADPTRLLGHRGLISLGHDEYWSKSMYDGALAARDAGVNFAFLGANACFRHIRLQPGPNGPARRMVCYKNAAEDPLSGHDDTDVTSDWPSPPHPRPESLLIGNMYQSNPVDAALTPVDASAWGLAGTGLRPGDTLPHVVGSEYDAFEPDLPGPRQLEIWAHSPLVCRGRPGHSDMTWYTQPGGGGVFAAGTNWWVSKLADNRGGIPGALLGRSIPGVTAPLAGITTNVLAVIGSGPASLLRPARPNWAFFYPPGAAVGPPGGVRGT